MDKANAMHLRDVAMNAIGAWIGQDIKATYKVMGEDVQVAFFDVDGREFKLSVVEVQ